MRTTIHAENHLPAKNIDEALRRAAQAWGVQHEYWDVFGKRHIANSGIQRSILRSMGFAVDSLEDLNAASKRRAELDWAVLAPPTLVLPLKKNAAPVNFPQDLAAPELDAVFQWEGGGEDHVRVRTESLPVDTHADIWGRRFVRRLLPLPAAAALGYHRLILTAGTIKTETRLILCPERTFQPDFLEYGDKGAGVAVSLYGLRSSRNWGCGDFTDLQAFCDWASESAGVGFVALNPLHSIPNRQPYNTSPYLPNCSFYRNPLYLDVERIEEVQRSTEAQRLLGTKEILQQFAALRNSRYVEYEKVYTLKLQFLKLGFQEFLNGGGSADFDSFVESEGELLDRYAVYCALDEKIHQQDPNIWIWPDWPAEYRDPKSAAVTKFRQEQSNLVLFYKWLQWHVDRQLTIAQDHAKQTGLAIGLYHDLALATDRCGSDLWAHSEHYIAGCRVGAPPDEFSPKGQDWAFPPPNSLAHKLDGYRLFAESIRKNCKHGGALRIDHVMRFFRLFWIPEGNDATQGTYVHDYAEDLVRILALESVRNRVVVIGEDLGTVEPRVREILHQFGVLSYRLLYFEKDAAGFKMPHEYPRTALVSVSTHDLPTLVGFWENIDIEARHKAGLLGSEANYHAQLRDRVEEKQKLLDLFHRLRLLPDWFARRASDIPTFTGELHYAAVGFLASTPSELMVLNQEDLFKDPEQQNLPGTTEQYPNWRHKMRYNIEELRTNSHARDCTRMFRGWLERTERLNQPA